MALTSSSPGPEYHPHRLFRLQPLLVQPSSPSLEYQDGQLSPSFDASFASSMSISSADPPLTATSNKQFADERHSSQGIVSSSPVRMDISPVPTRDTTSISARLAVASSQLPPPPRPTFNAESVPSQASASAISASTNKADYPFLSNLFQPRPAAVHHNSTSSLPASLGVRAPSPLPETAPLSLKARREGRPSLQHAASAGSLGLRAPFELKGVQSRSSLRDEVDQTDDDSSASANLDFGEEVEGPMAPPRIQSKRSGLPSGWNKAPSRPRYATSASTSTLLQAPSAPKHKSEPLVPTFMAEPESSPFRMDVDGASPNGRLSSPVSLRPPQHPRSVSDSRASDKDLALVRENSNPFFFPSTTDSPPRSNVVLENPESGASDRIGDLFTNDLSPIPQSRKRFLDEHQSPTPASPTPAMTSGSSLFASKPVRRSFEKAMSTTCIPQQGPIRRQRSSHALQLKKRPSLSSFATTVPPLPTHATAESAGPTTTAFGFKRHAPAINGKPKSMRRAFSVADAAPNALLRNTGGAASGKENHDSSSSSSTTSYRSSLCNTSTTAEDVGYFPPLSSSRRAGVASMDLGSSSEKQRPAVMVPETGSPVTGFRSQEAKGKALPCFGVKEDGLMRISAATLNDVQAGIYSSRIKRFVIIDCRFDYEYEGGHITDAINLSDVADVDKALLSITNLPEPSTSEFVPKEGKTVLIFHCEFSAKRAPTTAKHLRNQDRLKNYSVYPNVHYPEVYVLQGGYAEFFKSFPERCIGGYLEMDDPARLAERSVNLNHFRNQIQKRQFQRANTFTFGQAQHASTLLQAATNSRGEIERPKSTLAHRPQTGGLDKSFAFPSAKETLSSMSACHEEQEHEADSSFGTQGSSPGGGDSPCPTSKMGRGSLKLGKDFGMLSMTGASGPAARRGLERAQTSATLMFTR